MKSRDFAAVLDACATFLAALGRSSDGRAVRALVGIFTDAGATPVAKLVDRLTNALPTATGDGPTMGDAAKALAPLIPLLESSAKPAVPTDLRTVHQLLTSRAADSLMTITTTLAAPARAAKARSARKPSTVREDEIARFEAQLEANKKSPDAFQRVVQALSAPGGLTGAEIKHLAKRFSGKSGRTADDAVKNIWGRHQQAMTGAARIRAAGGRSAA